MTSPENSELKITTPKDEGDFTKARREDDAIPVKEKRDAYERRRDWFNDLNRVGRTVLWVVEYGAMLWGVTVVLMGTFFALQYVLPAEMVWISEARMEKLEAFVTGVTVTVLSFFIREWKFRK